MERTEIALVKTTKRASRGWRVWIIDLDSTAGYPDILDEYGPYRTKATAKREADALADYHAKRGDDVYTSELEWDGGPREIESESVLRTAYR